MSRARNLADLLDSNGDVVSGALDNVPPSNDASALTTGTLPVDRVPYVGRRNLIINGAMNVSQRGDYTTAVATTDGTYRVDRWQAETFGPTINFQHITADQPTGLSNSKSIKVITTSTGSGNIGHQQKVEDYKLFSNQTFTISAWIKTNRSDVRLSYFDGSTTYGQKTTAGSGEWEYISETFTNNRTSSQFVLFIKAVGSDGSSVSFSSGDYVEITGVQLEVGSVATPFEHRSYGEELALCQRYFYSVNITGAVCVGASSSLAHGSIYFPVVMRTNPTITGETVNRMTNFDVVDYSGSYAFNSPNNASNSLTAYSYAQSSGSTWSTGIPLSVNPTSQSAILTADAEL